MVDFTIITVVRNAKQTIEQALQSVAAQTEPSVEHLVLDGASTDGTTEIIKAFASNHPNVVWQSKPDKGMYYALNEGLQRASGKIIGVLHGDDLFENNQVLAKVKQALAHADCAYGDLIYTQQQAPFKVMRYWRSSPFKPGTFAKGWHPPHTTLFVKKDIYQRLGGFNTELALGNDIELMLRFFEKHRISSYYIPEILVRMRLGGISNRSLTNILRQNRSIAKAFKLHQIPFSWPTFVVHKGLHRLKQWVVQPKEVDYGN